MRGDVGGVQIRPEGPPAEARDFGSARERAKGVHGSAPEEGRECRLHAAMEELRPSSNATKGNSKEPRLTR